jgi:hypothetical protein
VAGATIVREEQHLWETGDEVSEDDLALLATSDTEIVKNSQVFCFDINHLEMRISHGDRWQQLIQAHLYFEHVLEQILREALPNPEEISLSRMGFGGRLDLARAMGLIPAEIGVAVKTVSKLRNKVAHDLNFSISNRDVLNVRSNIPKYIKKVIQKEGDSVAKDTEFWEYLNVLILKLEVIRQDHAAKRLLARKGEIRLRTVLRQTAGAKYVP